MTWVNSQLWFDGVQGSKPENGVLSRIDPYLVGAVMRLIGIRDYLSDAQRQHLDHIRECSRQMLEAKYNLPMNDHTMEHKELIIGNLDGFLRPWFSERERMFGQALVRSEVMVLLSAVYLQDIGISMIRPQILSHLSGFGEIEFQEALMLAAMVPGEEHRQFGRRHHSKLVYDWIAGAIPEIPAMPRLPQGIGISELRPLIARLAWAHAAWQADTGGRHLHRLVNLPEGVVRLDLLAIFLRLADMMAQDKRRIDRTTLSRQTDSVPQAWLHHYVSACRIGPSKRGKLPLVAKFRLPAAHHGYLWLQELLYMGTIGDLAHELEKQADLLAECGIQFDLPMISECDFILDPDMQPIPDDVLDAFCLEWQGRTRDVLVSLPSRSSNIVPMVFNY